MKNKINQRPAFLTILCVLSFIGGGWSFLSNTLTWLLSEYFAGFLTSKSGILERIEGSFIFNKLTEKAFTSMSETIEEISVVFLSIAVLSLVSIAGVYGMWKLKRVGFLLYAGAQLFMLCIPFILFGTGFSSVLGLVWGGFFSMLFIVMYAFNLKYMSD